MPEPEVRYVVEQELLARIDSACSLVGFRYSSHLPLALTEELIELAWQVRQIYNPKPRRDA